MSVTISKTNKPLNPRAKDLSPKGYNRASLYSGKALDFDGVNDKVTFGTISDLTFGTGDFSVVLDWQIDSVSTYSWAIAKNPSTDLGIGISNTGGLLRLWIGGTLSLGTENILGSDWKKIAIVRESGVVSAYINGVAISLTETAMAGSIDSGDLIIGSWVSNADFWNGLINNVRIFNTALTAGQVSDLYNNPEKIVPDGVADSALKLWLPMMEGAGTTVYDGSAPLTDYVTNGDFSNGTTGWTSSNATLSIEDGALKITSTGGNRPQANQIISGLTIGRKYLLSALARVGTTAFDMEIEIAGIAASSTYNKTSDSTFTYIYYEFTATSTSHQIQAKIDDGAVGVGETGYFDDIKLLDLGNYGSISGATWTSGVGAPVAQTALVGWNKMTPDHTNTILAPQGLTANKDIFGNSVSRNAYALNLDGASWAEVHDNASLDITSAITLETWVYNIQDGTTAKGIMGQWYGAAGGAKNSLLYKSDDDDFQFYVSIGGVSYNVTTGASVTSGWHHIVGIYDGVNMKIYVDGAESASTARTGTLDTSTGVLEIGRYFGLLANTLNSSIALPRIYNRALTATEVARNYNADKSKFGL